MLIRQRNRTDGNERGVALLLVIVVVVMLVIVAIPFAMSMRMEFKGSATFVYQVKARFAARGALEHAVHDLYKTHESMESSGALPSPFDTPYFDGPMELRVDQTGIVDPKSKALWSTHVEDEQGKVNLNSSSPYLIGNLLASAIATATVDAGETEIGVDPGSAGFFPPSNGMLWVKGELIAYQTFDGSTFTGCERGVYSDSAEFLTARRIREGQLIIDARAYLLAKLPYEVEPGKFYYYRTLDEMRTIAEQKASEDADGRSSFLYASLTPQEFERLKPLCTVHSHRPSGEGWIRTQKILSSFPNDGPEDQPEKITLTFPHYYPPGSIVRLTQGDVVDYAMVISNQFYSQTNKGHIWINKRLSQTYEKQVATIAMYEPHAININTAHPKVLYAMFKGIGLGIKGTGYRGVMISPEQANAITAAIVKTIAENGIYRNAHDLRITLTEEIPEELKLNRRQVDCVMANAAYRGMGMNIRTAPATYRSGNVFSIEATGIIHGGQGKELARHTIREIVAVAPPAYAVWPQGGQAQFRLEMNRTLNNHVITWPKFIPRVDLKFDYLKPPAEGEEVQDPGHMSLKTMELWPEAENFSNTHEGVELRKPIQFPLFGTKKKDNTLQSNGQIGTGSVSFFMKVIKGSGTRQYILDYGEKEYENRLSCYYDTEAGELVLEMCDSTIEPTKAQVRYPVELKEEVWYHLAVDWNSTMDGGLALFVDGQPVGQFVYFNDKEERIGSSLTSDISDDAQEIPVKDTTGFPDEGAIRIGAEVIEYESKTSNSFTVRAEWADGFKLQQTSYRGARGTVAMAHAETTRVVPWGYTMPLMEDKDLYVGGATLQGEFPKNVFTRVLVTKKSPNDTRPGPPRFVIGDTELEVDSTEGFPEKGVVAVWRLGKGTEYIYYSGKEAKKLTGLQRGLEGSSEDNYNNGSIVYPISIWVDKHADYDDSGMVQIRNEWIAYDKKNTTDGENFFLLTTGLRAMFIALLAGANMIHPLRGFADTSPPPDGDEHQANEKVIPVFEVPQTLTNLPPSLGLKPRPAGRFDRVTLINNNDDKQKQELVVTWQYLFIGDPDDPADDKYYIAFHDFTSQVFESKHTNKTRILKFPSSELPNVMLMGTVGGKSPKAEVPGGTVSFVVDEVLIEPYGLPGPHFTIAALDDAADIVPATGVNSFNAEGGLIRIGNEYMAYTGVEILDDTNQLGNLTGVRRGYLGTTAAAHSAGTPIMHVIWGRVGKLSSELTEESSQIDTTNGKRFPMEGHLLIGEELIGYSYHNPKESLYYMPANKDAKGSFRGRFGTETTPHDAGEPVYFVPVRYPDRYALEVDTPDLAYWQTRWSAPQTRFFRITWEEDLRKSKELEIHALVRIDGKPAWDEKPVIDPVDPQQGQLMLFTQGDGANKLGQLIGDRIEIRFLFKYKKDVLLTRFWKETPLLKSLKLHYATGPSIMHRSTAR